jgi:hypothetical protein
MLIIGMLPQADRCRASLADGKPKAGLAMRKLKTGLATAKLKAGVATGELNGKGAQWWGRSAAEAFTG